MYPYSYYDFFNIDFDRLEFKNMKEKDKFKDLKNPEFAYNGELSLKDSALVTQLWTIGSDNESYFYKTKVRPHKEVVITVNLPGVSKDTIEVEKRTNNFVRISANNYDYFNNKVSSKSKHLTVELPELNYIGKTKYSYSANPTDIKAEYIDGVLICTFTIYPDDLIKPGIKVKVQ